jgi:hypothetical protein
MSRALLTKTGLGVVPVEASGRDRIALRQATAENVWRELARASFAVISYVTPDGEPRSSGVVYGLDRGHLFVAVASDSWKARQIADGDEVAVTVPVRRGGLLSLLVPIPPATVSFHARAIVHQPGSLDVRSVSKSLESLLPPGHSESIVLELAPHGSFLTYGIGVSLQQMRNPAIARAHVPVTAILLLGVI